MYQNPTYTQSLADVQNQRQNEEYLKQLQQDQQMLDRTNSILGQFGLTEQGINSLYDKYIPERLTNPAQYGQASEAANLIYNNAISPEASRWANAEYEKQRAEEAQQRDLLGRQLSGTQNTMFSNLASSGGLDTGARERLAQNLANQSLFKQQEISSAGERARLGITARDMQNKQNMLMQSPTMFSQIGQLLQNTDKYNINNMNAYNQNRLNSLMNAKNQAAALWGNLSTNKPEEENGFWSTLSGALGGVAGLLF